MGKALFITGTGTDVGKTALSLAVLLWAKDRGLRAAYYKPIQCGTFPHGNPPVPVGDAEWVMALAGEAQPAHVTYRLRMAASPHLAAEREGVAVDLDRIRRELDTLGGAYDLLVAEGAGGAAVPVNRHGTGLASLAAEMSLPCLIASAPGLGTLHHTLTTCAFLESLGAPVAGFAFCHRATEVPETCADNRATLEALTGLPCFGELPYCPELVSGGRAFQARAASFYAPISRALEAWWNPDPK